MRNLASGNVWRGQLNVFKRPVFIRASSLQTLTVGAR